MEEKARYAERVKEWLKNPYNLALAGIILFIIGLRLYYFYLTKNQPLWWDESEYMAAAKHFAGIGSYTLQSIRLPGFSMLMSIFFMLNIGEPAMRFIALLLPSILVILLTYFMVKEMYPDRRIALISTLIIGVLWEHLFYSNRFHTENMALIFELLAIFILYKCYIKKEDVWFVKPKYSLIWIIALSAIAVFFRPGNIIFTPAIFLFWIVLNLKWFLKDGKRTMISLAVAVIGIAVVFMNIKKIPIVSANYNYQNKIAWNTLGVFYGFYNSIVSWAPRVLFYAFIFGLLLLAFDLIIGFKRIKNLGEKEENLTLKSDIFNLLLMASVMFAFIFMIRPVGYEFRWFFSLLPAMLVFTSKGIISFSEYCGMFLKSKKITYLLIIIVLFLGVYSQISLADATIRNKVDSYAPVRDSGLWIKENSELSDEIISDSVPQHSYYSERKVYSFGLNGLASGMDNETLFDKELLKLQPRYMIVSVFEPGFTPKWVYDWPQRHQDIAIPVKAYFADKEQKQPVLIIYEMTYLSLNVTNQTSTN